MLTGESVPITKVALPELDDEIGDAEPLFSFKEHSKHILFCGTQVLQTRFYGGRHVQAVVLRTAYSTLKGQLVRSIMYPKPVDFRFTKDLFKFVGFLSCIAGLGFMYTIAVMIYRGSSLRKIILRSLDIITIVVPPALPGKCALIIYSYFAFKFYLKHCIFAKNSIKISSEAKMKIIKMLILIIQVIGKLGGI